MREKSGSTPGGGLRKEVCSLNCRRATEAHGSEKAASPGSLDYDLWYGVSWLKISGNTDRG